jgi:hypothetical protein
MKPLLKILLLFFALRSSGQSKYCKENFLFVKKYIEENSASFKDNINKKNKSAYNQFSTNLLNKIPSNCDTCDCAKLIETLLKYFKDNHLSVNKKTKIFNENNDYELNEFFKTKEFVETEKISLDSNYLQNLYAKKLTEIEGIYIENGSDYYKVALINIGNSNIYKGIIIETKTRFWQVGQVKFEITLNSDTTFITKRYDKFHKKLIENGSFSNSNLIGLNYRKYNAEKAKPKYFEFKLLNDSICYLQLKSFSGNLFNDLDTFYKSISTIIKSKPYLVIDIRNNGGGSDACYTYLRQFFYTNPLKTDKVDILATSENIKNYEKNYAMMLADSAKFGIEALNEQQRQIQKMKKSKLHNFVNIQTEHQIILDSVLSYPKKVAILFNNQTASTAEDLIFDATQSKKVLTIGENSGGFTGYGNVIDIDIPNSDLTLSYTTIRYRKQRIFDGIGFTPHIKRDTKQDILTILQGIF